MTKIWVLIGSNRDYSYGDEWAIRAYLDKTKADAALELRDTNRAAYQKDLSGVYDRVALRFKGELPRNTPFSKYTDEQILIHKNISAEKDASIHTIYDRYLAQFEEDRMSGEDGKGSLPDHWYLWETELV